MIRTFILFSILFSSSLCFAQLVDRIVAVVNTEVVLESDFSVLTNRLKKQRALIDETLLLDGPSALVSGNKQAQLDFLINEKLLDSEVKRLNLGVTLDRVDQEINSIAKRNGISRQEVLSSIKAEGISVADYQDSLRSRIERQSLIEGEVISKLRITDDDALGEYLRRHPEVKATAHEFTLSHIFFNPRKGSAEAALQRADVVLSRLRRGENFESLAQQFSEDPNFSNDGLLGTFKSGEFMKELEDSISGLNPGEVSSVVKSKMGFHIVKLVSKKVTPDPRFEKEKEKIKAQLFDNAFKRQLKIWLQSKKEESFLRINSL